MASVDLSNQIVTIIEEYLGPASKRFVYRLINFHLNKSPAELTIKDLPKLIEWVKVSLGVLTNDKTLIDECEKKLLKLTS